MEKLKATAELLSYLGSLDIKLWVEGDRLKFNAPKGALTPKLRSQIKERKTEIIKFLYQNNLTAKDASFQVTQRLVIKDGVRDSTIWDSVKPQKTDIVIASCYKSGTTLTQQIINLLINAHDDFESIHQLSPWVEEARGAQEKIELIKNLPGTRIFKTHLPFQALPYYVEWKYIYLVRDGRDVGVSLYEQRRSRIVKPIQDEFGEFWDRWVEGEPHWSFWEHIKSWWAVKDLPNILMVHYNNLIDNKPAEIDRIAKFLDLQIDSHIKNDIVERSSLEYMKINAQKFQPVGYFQGQTFINKGKKNRWKNLLTSQQLDRYEKVISEKLEPECANWVKNGVPLIFLQQDKPATLVPIQVQGKKTPFFCIHPVGGSVFCYSQLARELGMEQPFYGLQAIGLNGESQPLSRIEDMASTYIKAIQTVQPQGPYQLGAWSFGGTVALEMAKQLNSLGHEVAMLALIDSFNPTILNRPKPNQAMLVSYFAENLSRLCDKELSVSVDELQQLGLDEQLNYVFREAKRLQILPSETKIEQMQQLFAVFQANVQAHHSYVAQPYSGEIILFYAEDKSEQMAEKQIQFWSSLANGGIKIHKISGHHFSIISSKGLAKELSSYLRF